MDDLSFVKPSSKDECGDNEEKEIVELLKSSKFYKQLQAERVSEGAFIIDDVLSEEECSFICEKLDKCDSMSFWNPEGRKTKIVQFRNVDTIEIYSQNVADVLWTRIKDSGISTDTFISDSVTSDVYETGCDGTWTAQGLNNHLLFAKYPSGGSFAPHTDSNVVLTLNIRSFFSVILYLNSIPSGGETRFFHQDSVNNLTLVGRPDNEIWSCDDSFTLFEVSPKAGRLLLFSQHLAHSGQPVDPPYNKYINTIHCRHVRPFKSSYGHQYITTITCFGLINQT